MGKLMLQTLGGGGGSGQKKHDRKGEIKNN